MVKALIITAALIGIGVAYWLISPLFITTKVTEDLPIVMPAAKSLEDAAPLPINEMRQGVFVGLAGHNASGTAKLLKIGDRYFIRFETDFKITNGPDLFVHFGKNDQYAANARLGTLKGNEGSQNYEVPGGLNPSDYNEIWVWCRAFSVPFGKAVLE